MDLTDFFYKINSI